MHWLHAPATGWCRFEAASCTSTALRALVTASHPTSASPYTNNPVVINTLKIWFQLRRSFRFNDLLNLSPMHNNHLFLPARLDSEFTLWQRQGISTFKDMYINSIFTLMTYHVNLASLGLAYFDTFKSATSFNIRTPTFDIYHHLLV